MIKKQSKKFIISLKIEIKNKNNKTNKTMRKIVSTPIVNYKVVSKNLDVDYSKGTPCFQDIFHIIDEKFDTNTVITLTNFTVESSQKYIKKYFEILSIIFKIEIVHIDENTIEVKNFKSLFYLKSFLTMYRLLFEPCHHYNDEGCIKDFEKNLIFFEELCNSDFKKLDQLEQLCTSYNNAEIYKHGHCLKDNSKSLLKIISIKDLENYKEELYSNKNISHFFTNGIIIENEKF